ncbi:hypothetical protein SAMN04487911_10937 [Arenibacter nanhaiticus]|uniref:Helix-turn-helix domain-containing protein n=1 Tax=Arenibacter nanhaiticus TaxID=558155 RepID=A0A1M6FPD2_9FLAO|nr:hypothetical protein [Arenibacter nanhaiticus]SHI99608.1 hypothetical protein SAMN04487911_10937 [Arenibacter nanhaiticus]
MKQISPKQDFKINLEATITSKELGLVQRLMIIYILINHQKNKDKLSYIKNGEMQNNLRISTITFTTHRNKLEEMNLFTVMIKVDGRYIEVEPSARKSKRLYYFPNWDKLKGMNLITT